jgi:hypothetical protein
MILVWDLSSPPFVIPITERREERERKEDRKKRRKPM